MLRVRRYALAHRDVERGRGFGRDVERGRGFGRGLFRVDDERRAVSAGRENPVPGFEARPRRAALCGAEADDTPLLSPPQPEAAAAARSQQRAAVAAVASGCPR